jgi:hypothetical protein
MCAKVGITNGDDSGLNQVGSLEEGIRNFNKITTKIDSKTEGLAKAIFGRNISGIKGLENERLQVITNLSKSNTKLPQDSRFKVLKVLRTEINKIIEKIDNTTDAKQIKEYELRVKNYCITESNILKEDYVDNGRLEKDNAGNIKLKEGYKEDPLKRAPAKRKPIPSLQEFQKNKQNKVAPDPSDIRLKPSLYQRLGKQQISPLELDSPVASFNSNNDSQASPSNSHLEPPLLFEDTLTASLSTSPNSSLRSTPPLIQPNIRVTSTDITVTQSPKGKAQFSRYKDTDPFAFDLKLGTNTFQLQGAGLDSKGYIKASGSFGRVFFGEDQTGREVAVKVVTAQPGETIDDLKKEGDFLITMNGSEHIVASSEVGYMEENPPRMFIVMNKIDGEELSSKKGSLSLKNKVKVLKDVALGLQELHNKGIIHRDLKPDNTLVENSNNKARLLDLGISEEAVDRPSDPSGTPLYMSPETLNEKEQGIKSDTYSFGIMMHELLTDEVLGLHNGNVGMRLNSSLTVNHRSYSMRGIPKEASVKIAKLVNSCLNRNPNKRIDDQQLIQDMSKIIKELEKHKEV